MLSNRFIFQQILNICQNNALVAKGATLLQKMQATRAANAPKKRTSRKASKKSKKKSAKKKSPKKAMAATPDNKTSFFGLNCMGRTGSAKKSSGKKSAKSSPNRFFM